jgi:hypothetical protein
VLGIIQPSFFLLPLNEDKSLTICWPERVEYMKNSILVPAVYSDEEKVTKEITDKIKKLAHVPVQTWKGQSPSYLFGGWFSTLDGFKTLVGARLLVLGPCLILHYLIPLVLQIFRTN